MSALYKRTKFEDTPCGQRAVGSVIVEESTDGERVWVADTFDVYRTVTYFDFENAATLRYDETHVEAADDPDYGEVFRDDRVSLDVLAALAEVYGESMSIRIRD